MMQRLQGSKSASRRGGFTLIELLAVILIIAMLMAFLLPNLFAGEKAVKVNSTRSLLAQLSAEIDAYEREAGDLPRSTFPAALDPKPTPVNMGIEMLVIALMPADGSYQASGEYDEKLVNTDGDDTKRSHTRFTKSDAFELRDPWDNPIVYLHRRSYEKGCSYLAYVPAEGDFIEQRVAAVINPITGDPYRPRSYQLISAGPDGVFGSQDDIGNFETQ